MNISIEVWVSIGVNVCTLAFCVGVWRQSLLNLKEQYKDLKQTVKDNHDSLNNTFAEKIKEWQNFFSERFKTLEKKQDKHNSLIERMVVVEQSVKSSHHRADELSDRVNEIERKINHGE